QQFAQQPELLRGHVGQRIDHTCDITAGAVQALHETRFDRVGSAYEDDRNGLGRVLSGAPCDRGSDRNNSVHATADQINGKGGYLIVVSVGKPEVEGIIASLDKTLLAHALPEQ